MRALVCCVLLTMMGCSENKSTYFEVEGTLKNVPAKTVYLEESALSNLQPVIVDSAAIEKDGSFELKTLTKEESVFSLRLDQDMYPFVSFINDTKEITINADFKSTDLYNIRGSKASEKLKDYINTNSVKVRSIYSLTQAIDSLAKLPGKDSLISLRTSERNKAVADLKQYTTNVIKNSESAALVMFVLGSYQSIAANPSFSLEAFQQQEVTDIISTTARRFPEHESLTALQTKIAAQQKQQAQQQTAAAPALWVNKQAPDFTLTDVNGKPVSLSSFKGKYVLVDFWASWCGPCRAENPNVVQAFEKHKDKNFTILGVSLDQKKEPWLKAIKDDQLNWTHVSDLKFWESIVVNMYGFEGIPFNVLVDPNGVVIAEGLRGEDLDKKLSEVLK